MLVFIDTEFTELSIAPGIISIGLVSEDGNSVFYAELSDTYQSSECSDFVREVVLPKLQGGEAIMTMRELSLRLVDWLNDFSEPVQLATDSLQWDWQWIEKIFAEAGAYLVEQTPAWQDIKDSPHRLASVARPANVDGRPYVLQQTTAFILAIEQAFERGLLHCHHALDDAKANRIAWLALQEAK